MVSATSSRITTKLLLSLLKRLIHRVMKRFVFFVVLLIIVASCGVVKHQKYTRVTDVKEQELVLYKHYPQLWEYYKEGVLGLVWIKKYVNEQGVVEYKEKHYLQSNFITDYSDRMYILKTDFPEIYNLFTQGKVALNEMYKYVDEKGTVRIHISYRNL